MSLKRDMLVEAGIEDKAVIDSLMNAYGSGIENAKAQAKSELQAENDSLKQQLEQQSQALNDLQAKEGASEEVKQQLTDLQAKFEAYKTESEANLAQVINPQVMADMVSAKLPKLIKFTPLAVVETTLIGRPGDELTVPQWTYSGDATEITEGQAIPIDQLGTKEARRYTLFQIMAMEVLGGVLVFTATIH